MRVNPNSWFSSVISFLRNDPNQDLGMLWLGSEARHARSLNGPGEHVRVCFRNNGDETLILCWVDGSGNLHHFYSLHPHAGRDEDFVTAADRVESTQTGHAFLVLAASDVQKVQTTKSLEGTTFVGAYRPSFVAVVENTRRMRTRKPHTLTEETVHLVSIHTQKNAKEESDCWPCCGDAVFLRGKHSKEQSEKAGLKPSDSEPKGRESSWSISIRQAFVDSTPIDSTCKKYHKLNIHNDMAVYAEENWHGGNLELEKVFRNDLQMALQCFPNDARERLVQGTAFWLNGSLKYGPAACPVNGKGMCFHPESDWLVQNGCHKEKTHGIELYQSKEYLRDRKLWGPGGVLIHELSHAYHCLCLPDGFKNEEIVTCFQEAMEAGIYDSVAVHGSQGPKAKAYACTNSMEYFAELSTAFLGGTNENIEFNKWFPFNRKQLQEHDLRAFELLKKLWRIPI